MALGRGILRTYEFYEGKFINTQEVLSHSLSRQPFKFV